MRSKENEDLGLLGRHDGGLDDRRGILRELWMYEVGPLCYFAINKTDGQAVHFIPKISPMFISQVLIISSLRPRFFEVTLEIGDISRFCSE